MVGEIGEQRSDFGGGRERLRRQQRTRFCSRSTPCFTVADAFGILASHLGERGAGHFLLLHGGERLREPQQRLRRLGVARVLGGEIEEGLRRGIVALALEQALAEPEFRLGGAAVGRIFLQERLEGVFRQRVVLAQHIAVAEVVGVLRRIGRWRDRGHRAGGAEIARRRRRQLAAVRRYAGFGARHTRQRRQVERRTGPAAARRTDRRLGRDDRRRLVWHAAERTRHARSIGILRRIEHVGAASRRGRWRRRRCCRQGLGLDRRPDHRLGLRLHRLRGGHARSAAASAREADFRAAGCGTATARWCRSSGESALRGARSAAPARWSDRRIRPGRWSAAAASARTCGQSPTAANSPPGRRRLFATQKAAIKAAAVSPRSIKEVIGKGFGLPAAV